MSTPTASLRMIHMIEAVTDRLEGSPRQLRRLWSDEFKLEAVEEACRPGVNISAIARRIGITPSQLYRWRRDLCDRERPGAIGVDRKPDGICDRDQLGHRDRYRRRRCPGGSGYR
jgi:transposase